MGLGIYLKSKLIWIIKKRKINVSIFCFFFDLRILFLVYYLDRKLRKLIELGLCRGL